MNHATHSFSEHSRNLWSILWAHELRGGNVDRFSRLRRQEEPRHYEDTA